MLQDKYLCAMGSFSGLCLTLSLNQNSGLYLEDEKKVLEVSDLEISDPSRALSGNSLSKPREIFLLSPCLLFDVSMGFVFSIWKGLPKI